MHGMTTAEMATIDENVDRHADGLTNLEARFIVNGARAGNPAAVRAIEALLRNMGVSRTVARHRIAQLRALGPVPEPSGDADERTFTEFLDFLKGLNS